MLWKLSRNPGQGNILAEGQWETELYMMGENMKSIREVCYSNIAQKLNLKQFSIMLLI